jgi:hypothetical protein
MSYGIESETEQYTTPAKSLEDLQKAHEIIAEEKHHVAAQH